jgi:hypothetical protein
MALPPSPDKELELERRLQEIMEEVALKTALTAHSPNIKALKALLARPNPARRRLRVVFTRIVRHELIRLVLMLLQVDSRSKF